MQNVSVVIGSSKAMEQQTVKTPPGLPVLAPHGASLSLSYDWSVGKPGHFLPGTCQVCRLLSTSVPYSVVRLLQEGIAM